MPKIRVFKTSSKDNPNEVHIGIPASVQEDTDITEITLTQIEVLPPPKTLLELYKTPLEKINAPVNAAKSVQKSTLDPGFKFKAVPKGKLPWFFPKMKELEVEEVIIPDGFIHLDDFDEWQTFNYNKSYHLTGKDFQPLPDEKRLPIKHRYHLFIKGDKFKAVHDNQIDKINVYSRRISKFSADYEWVFWKSMTRTDREWDQWPYKGEYVFRAVPCFAGNKPMGGYKEFRVLYEEDESLSWSAIQITKDIFQIRMEGPLGENINYVEVLEKGNVLARSKLIVDKDGIVEVSFRVKGVSNDKFPRLEYRFYRKQGIFKSYITNSYQDLERHYAIEPIGFLVNRISNTKFSINIQDSQNLLYQPLSAIDPFGGQQWNTAIQSGKLICKLLINRHQDGEVTHYGAYYINVTSEKEIQFINKPPFGEKVKKVNHGFEFEFEDTQIFRQVANLDNPDMGKKLAYEFRLQFWSAGIEESLKTSTTYSFIKEVPVMIKNRRRAYKFNYNTWKEEHPRKKYTGIIPVDVEYKNLNHHLRYSTSPKAYILPAAKTPLQRTRNIEIEDGEWKVLYYYHDKDDEIHEFPYYQFEIKVPTTSVLEIEKLEIFIDNEGKKDVSLGVFHPSEKIEILDFVGYFEARKLITRKIPLRKTILPMQNIISPRKDLLSVSRPSMAHSKGLMPSSNKRSLTNSFSKVKSSSSAKSSLSIPKSPLVSSRKSGHSRSLSSIVKQPSMGPLPSMKLNTNKRKLEANISNSRINNTVSKVVESGTLKYRVEIHYKDSRNSTRSFSVAISSRPKLPPEPIGNLSVAVGNKTFKKSTIQLPAAAASTLASVISQIPMSKKPQLSKNKSSSVTGISRAKTFGGFKS